MLCKIKGLILEGNYPWYVWDVTFSANETKLITISYDVPLGMGFGYGKQLYILI